MPKQPQPAPRRITPAPLAGGQEETTGPQLNQAELAAPLYAELVAPLYARTP